MDDIFLFYFPFLRRKWKIEILLDEMKFIYFFLFVFFFDQVFLAKDRILDTKSREMKGFNCFRWKISQIYLSKSMNHSGAFPLSNPL